MGHRAIRGGNNIDINYAGGEHGSRNDGGGRGGEVEVEDGGIFDINDEGGPEYRKRSRKA